jgi:hypothetical protein
VGSVVVVVLVVIMPNVHCHLLWSDNREASPKSHFLLPNFTTGSTIGNFVRHKIMFKFIQQITKDFERMGDGRHGRYGTYSNND